MASSKSKNNTQIYDSIRKLWVEKTPEEEVRQKLIKKMTQDLGYPSALITVEKELSKLPAPALSSKRAVPQRRLDILVFANHIHPKDLLAPLLLIECKSVALTSPFAQQVIGYNAFVKAPFVALANGEEVLIGWFEENLGHYRFESGLPKYINLIKMLRRV